MTTKTLHGPATSMHRLSLYQVGDVRRHVLIVDEETLEVVNGNYRLRREGDRVFIPGAKERLTFIGECPRLRKGDDVEAMILEFLEARGYGGD